MIKEAEDCYRTTITKLLTQNRVLISAKEVLQSIMGKRQRKRDREEPLPCKRVPLRYNVGCKL
jgi:hypothetical protein